MKRKKVILWALAALLFCSGAWARPVDATTARRVAENWMRAVGMKNPASLQDITAQVGYTEFYIFAAPEGGFVLVSGDDCTRPVLAYGLEGRFETKAIPSHIRGFLSDYEREIRWLKGHSQLPAGNRDAARPLDWENLIGGEAPLPVLTTALAPMLTTTWDQSPYYNALCPDDNSGRGRAVTGCVATATAQVMKYHNHPTTGYGSHTYSSYAVGLNGSYTYNNLTANFGATTYQWSQMPNVLTATSSTAQVNAVATLMYHVGVADEMSYSPDESGARNYYNGADIAPSSQSSLMHYFKYAPDMIVLRRGDTTDAAYSAALRAELDQQRPVLYSGSDTLGGHSFVLDGYDANGLFHVNWGWGGSMDGYYAVGDLSPRSGGTGGNATYTFNLRNAALLRIRPNTAWSTTGTTTFTANVQAGSPSGCSAGVYHGGEGSNSGTSATNFAFGDTVLVLATAAEGYRFNGWTDGDRTNPRSMIANGGSYTFTATFAPIFSDTASYCPTGASYNSYNLNGNKWGIMLPASILDATSYLSAVQFFAPEMGTYNITIYEGASHTSVATTSYTVGADEEDTWVEVPLGSSVQADEDLWIMLSASGVDYPAAFTSYSGVEGSCVIGDNFNDYGSSWMVSFMIKGIFSTVSPCVISTFPFYEGFEDGSALGCWRISDVDQDGNGWLYATNTNYPWGHNSMSALASASYDNNSQSPLTPDNWLISPGFELPAGSAMRLKWYAAGRDSNYAAEHYSVYVSTTGNTVSDFTSAAVYSGNSTAQWTQQEVNLAAYAGQTVYVAFRHHNCTDMFFLVIDDVEISAAGSAPPVQQYTITVASNNASWGSVSGGGTYNEGVMATIRATAANGYHFAHWQDGNTQNPRTVTVTANATYTATFEADEAPVDDCIVTTFPYTMDFEDGAPCWSIRNDNQDTVAWSIIDNYGYNGSICAYVMYAPNADDWLISPSFVSAGDFTVKWKARAINSNYPESYQVWACTNDTSTLLFSETLSDTVYVNRSGNFTVEAGDTVALIFRYISDDMYAFFLDDIVVERAQVQPPVQQYTLTVVSNNDSWGTVSGGGTYDQGATATLRATPANGYHFVSWNDGNTQSTRTVTVTGNATYVATFAANVGIADATAQPLGLYPNPASDYVVVSGIEGQGVIKVLDAVGRQTMSFAVDAEHCTLDIRQLPCGTYFIHLQSSTGTSVTKLVVR